MLVFPWLAVTFIKGDGGMAVCFILFFAVNPIYAICSGAYAGKNIKIFWTLPIITALFFLLGTWLFFSMGEKSIYFICVGIFALRNCSRVNFHVCKEKAFKKLNKFQFVEVRKSVFVEEEFYNEIF